MIAEWIGARHRPPLWVGNAALGLAVCCLLIAQRVIGPGGDSGSFVVFLPPLMTLALVSLLPAPAWRLMAVWCVAAGGAGIFLLRPPMPDPTSATVQGLRALLLGGATVFHAGIAALTALGYKSLLMAALLGEALVADLLGLAISAPNALTAGAWATHGLIWSAVAGWGVWGAAATAGRFDAGRLAPFRLTAMVVAAGMLLWIVVR